MLNTYIFEYKSNTKDKQIACPLSMHCSQQDTGVKGQHLTPLRFA